MNIFYLDDNPVVCAQYHCDAHVRKMIVEYAQILSTAHRCIEPEHPENVHLYKSAYVNHPSTIWARQTSANYHWLYELWVNCCYEFYHRWAKSHATWEKLRLHLIREPTFKYRESKTLVPLCMPDDCKGTSALTSYRKYYNTHKRHLHVWTGRGKPDWITNE